MGLTDRLQQWIVVGNQPEWCPECGGELHEKHVRAPNHQSHYRGVLALVCENPDCQHTEPIDEGPNH